MQQGSHRLTENPSPSLFPEFSNRPKRTILSAYQFSARSTALKKSSSGYPPAHKYVLAFYFPQFHEFEVNNVLWGKGYTDFRGVEAATTARYDYPVIRPLNGSYNILDHKVRHEQACLAQQYGVYGFVFYHYWFSGGPIMEAPLLALLEDGEPDLPFAVAWANEHWTRRWDGGYSEVLIEQRYDEGDWRPHFDWILPLFRHKNYILKDNKPMLVIYRSSDIWGFREMMASWSTWAQEAGFSGLHIVQMNGNLWKDDVWNLQPGVDGIAEFFPNLYASREVRPINSLLSYTPERFGATPENYYHGVHASFNNKPRHLKDGKETVLPYHPANLRAALRQQLSRTQVGGYVFLNAWNEWGEGVAVEPSVEFGHGWLQAIKEAISEDATGLEAPVVPKAGVPTHGVGKNVGAEIGTTKRKPISKSPLDDIKYAAQVCIVVRTDSSQFDIGSTMYTLKRSLVTLSRLERASFLAFVVDTGETPFPDLGALVAAHGDDRFTVVDTPKGLRGSRRAWELIDFVIATHCVGGGSLKSEKSYPAAPWFLVTSGKDWYTPDALNYLPEDGDMVIMNSHIPSAFASQGHRRCCTRLSTYECHPAAPRPGGVDLGAMVIGTRSWEVEKLSFSFFAAKCLKSDTGAPHDAESCADGAMAEYAYKNLEWNVFLHPPEACSLLSNPNHISCNILGGLYYDTDDVRKAQCFEPPNFPIALSTVDWDKFTDSKGCVCEKER